jgi:hypothetical protein
MFLSITRSTSGGERCATAWPAAVILALTALPAEASSGQP